MEGAKNIEALSLFFTAGAVAGTMLSGACTWAVCAAILPATALPFFFREKLIHGNENIARIAMWATFLLLGVFCAFNASMLPVHGVTGLAADGAARLRELIGTIPFGGKNTAPLLDALLTGDRSGLSTELVSVFRKAEPRTYLPCPACTWVLYTFFLTNSLLFWGNILFHGIFASGL